MCGFSLSYSKFVVYSVFGFCLCVGLWIFIVTACHLLALGVFAISPRGGDGDDDW